MRIGYRRGALAASVALMTAVACGTPKLDSHWRDRAISVDGIDSEWDGTKYHIDKSSVDVGVINDGEYLYLTASTVDRATIVQILGRGLEVWFDASGGKNKSFGLRYPLGMMERVRREQGDTARGTGMEPDQARRRGRMGGRGGTAGRPLLDPSNPEEMQIFAARALEDDQMLLLAGTDDPGRQLSPGESDVVAARMSYVSGRLVYEIKVALQQQAAFGQGIGAQRDKPVGIGLLIPEPDRPMSLQGARMRGTGMGGAGMAGGLRGGSGGGGGRMRGGPAGAGGAGTTEPMAIWFRVELASQAGGEL